MSFLRSNICYFHTLSDMSDTCKAAQVFAYTCMLAVNVHKVTVFPYLGDSYLYYVAFSPHQTIENTLLLLPSPPFPFPPFFFSFFLLSLGIQSWNNVAGNLSSMYSCNKAGLLGVIVCP